MRLTHLKGIFFGALLIVCIFALSCSEDITGQKSTNLPPETSLFVQADTLNLTQSVQTIYWDGQDNDGFVVGFYYTWKENPQPNDWIWTTDRSETFPLQIAGTDTSYRFQVKAVDNQDAEDPTPATQIFPIRNSPPTISWTSVSQIPDTTFTVAGFTWNATDLDGQANINFFEYSLDDTINWRKIAGEKRQITLTADSGLTAGDHAFYIRAVDLAGATSSTIRMPELNSEFWYVKEPNGRYLLIDDHNVAGDLFPDDFYRSMLDTLLAAFGQDYSYWDIEDLFPASAAQFVETMKLFDRVIWYTDIVDEADPHFIAAQIAIPQFRNKDLDNPGKIIYTVQFNAGFGSQGDPLAFSPVESLGNSYVIPTNSIYYVDPEFHNNYPNSLPTPLPQELKVSKFLLGSLALVPKANAIPMYRYDDPNLTVDPIFIIIGRNDNTGQYDFVFSGTPLHLLRNNNNVDELFKIIIEDIFQP